MNNRKKIDRIFKLIDKLTLKGKDNILEYYKLIDDMILSGDYDNLLQCLELYYGIKNLKNLNDVKHNTWKHIMFSTPDIMLKKIQRLYQLNNVYQVSFDIFDSLTNIKLGSINEIEVSFNESIQYYIKNKEYSKIKNTTIINLEVTKDNSTILLNDFDYSLSNNQNTYNKYVNAINILKQ